MEAAQSTSPPQQGTPPDPAAFLVALEARQVGQPPVESRNERGAAQARAARLRQIAFERQVAAEEGDDVPPLPVGGRPPKIRYNHEAMANLILMNPGIKQKEIAIAMGYTEAWISTVMCSDAFQAYLAKRQAEVIDPEITLTLRERATGVATRSMQVLMEKLAKPADAISDGLVLRAFELSAKATGMGGNAPPPPAVDASANLAMLADRLCRLQGRTQSADVVDVQVREGGA
jgi:hypothetical protein